jgi:uncharacterized membrane protein YqaE (UPF0057 family)
MDSVGPISTVTITENIMRLLLAIILPWLQFFTIGRPFAGIVCLILQITLIGWIPAAIWSVYALSQYKTDEKIREALGNQYRR